MSRSLAEPLPERLAARLRERPPRREAGGRRTAAVLAPLTGKEGDRRLLLTRRAADLRRQPGDIAFPGGMVDPGDGSERDAALREAREEIGLDPGRVRVLGRLDEWPTVHGFRLVPFLGVVSPGARFAAGPEVDEIFEAPLAELLAPGAETVEYLPRPPAIPGPPEVPLKNWRYHAAGREVWGITARIVRSVLDLLEE